MKERYDKIIIGAGIYGLYAALRSCQQRQQVLVLECEDDAFKRATYINQARVHQGYHYPRSLSTALKSAGYFERFNRNFGFCINRDFDQIYAASSQFSWTDGNQFKEFCRAAGIPCEELNPDKYFKPGMCDGAFLTREYTYDALILKNYFLKSLGEFSDRFEIRYGADITAIELNGECYEVVVKGAGTFRTDFVLNAAYAGLRVAKTWEDAVQWPDLSPFASNMNCAKSSSVRPGKN